MASKDEDLVTLLLGGRTPRVVEMEREGVVPSFLAAKYARESAAMEAGERSNPSPALVAALLRAAFEDEEEDVRAAARHALIMHGGPLGDAVYLALAMDPDPRVRESALDEALEVGDPARRARLIEQAVRALRDDETSSVRERARGFDSR